MSAKGQVDYPFDKIFVRQACFFCGFSDFFAVSDVRVGIRLEYENFIVWRESQVDSAVIAKLENTVYGFADPLYVFENCRLEVGKAETYIPLLAVLLVPF